MAKVTIYGTTWQADIKVILQSFGHIVTTVADNSTVAFVEATNPDVIVCLYERSGFHDVLLDLHELGYKLLIGGQTYNSSTDSVGVALGLFSSRQTSETSDTIATLLQQPHPLFTEAGFTGSSVVVGSGTLIHAPEAKSSYVLAKNITGNVVVSFGVKDEIGSNGYTLNADALFLGVISWTVSTRNTNLNYQNLIDAAIKLLTGGEFVITGTTRDKLGVLASFQVRAYKTSTGAIIKSVTSDPITGLYEIDPLEPSAMLMCVSNSSDVSTLVKDNVDHLVPNNFDFSASSEYSPSATFTALVTGNVTQFGLPHSATIVAVSSGEPKILGYAVSDETTGDYTIDVQPYQAEVLLYYAPDYGVEWVANNAVVEGQILHPPTPNKKIYRCANTGALGSNEPDWSQAVITSGDVVLNPKPLIKPLMSGLIKPTVTPL